LGPASSCSALQLCSDESHAQVAIKALVRTRRPSLPQAPCAPMTTCLSTTSDGLALLVYSRARRNARRPRAGRDRRGKKSTDELPVESSEDEEVDEEEEGEEVDEEEEDEEEEEGEEEDDGGWSKEDKAAARRAFQDGSAKFVALNKYTHSQLEKFFCSDQERKRHLPHRGEPQLAHPRRLRRRQDHARKMPLVRSAEEAGRARRQVRRSEPTEFLRQARLSRKV